MYTFNEAKSKMAEYINFLNELYSENYPDLGINIALFDKLTEKHDFGWVFFYQSENDNVIAGNGPIIIENKTLDMYQMMTALSINDNISLFLEDKNRLPRIDKNKDGIWDTVNLE